MFIYIITNIFNNKIYIGKTTQSDPYKRWNQHCSNWRLQNSKQPIHKAIKKYGKDKFIFELVKYCNNINELNQEETYWIEQIKHLPNYNMVPGGGGGSLYGRKHKPETIKKIREKALGRKWSEEMKIKLSKIKIGNQNRIGKNIK